MADIQLNAQSLVKVTGLNQKFGQGEDAVNVLSNVDFELPAASFSIIYGQSGSGKSTLLNVLSGLQPPTTGTVTFGNQNIYTLTPDELAHFRAHRIGIVYQQNYWVHSLNVIDNVAMPLYFIGYPRKLAQELAEIALERVQMQTYVKKYPVLLSGGEQQRIAMARAIVNDPMFIIADEPTGSLDSKNGDMIINLLQNANSQQRRTIVLVTHNMEYLPLATHLLHIQDGQVQTVNDKTAQDTVNKMVDDMKARIVRLAASRKAQKGTA
jgi:ABC-type lipoprotein export system ATPase subunit